MPDAYPYKYLLHRMGKPAPRTDEPAYPENKANFSIAI